VIILNILGLKDINSKKLIYLSNFKDEISFNKLNCNNFNFEILTFKIDDSYEDNFKFKKIKCADTIIFTFNFIQRIILQASVNSKVESFDFKFQVGGSFNYNDDDYSPQIYPIDAFVEFIDSNICFYINYGIVDDFKNYDLNADHNFREENSLFTNQNVFSNYTYIDINTEFL
jgi:hypothetical protein